jgi:hypothetical protein
MRPLAQETHIILWTIENLIHVADPLALVRSLPEVDYANASVGFHPYATYRRRDKLCGREPRTRQLLNLIEILKSAFPTVMTELSPNAAGAPDSGFLMMMEKMGISWGYLGGQGFTDARDGKAYGPSGGKVSVAWPK